MILIGMIESLPLYLNIISLNIGDIACTMQFNYSYLPFVAILSNLVIGEEIRLMKGIGILLVFLLGVYRSYLNYADSHKLHPPVNIHK